MAPRGAGALRKRGIDSADGVARASWVGSEEEFGAFGREGIIRSNSSSPVVL